MADDKMEFEGVVESVIHDKVKVSINEKWQISATISGKLRQNGIKLLPLDRVTVKISPYDLNKGIITFRLKN